MNPAQEVLAPVVCIIVATAVQPVVIGLLRRRAVIDMPNDRSSHTVPTPRGGGLAVGVGLLAGLAVIGNPTWFALAVGLVLFLGIGLAEDLVGVPVRVRLFVQLLAGGIVGELFVAGRPMWSVAAALTVAGIAVWITAYTNAFNFMDGVNGISGAHALLVGSAYVGIGLLDRDLSLVVVAAVVGAGGLAFLPWNAVRARVFLGDVGSYGIGAVLAALAVHMVLRGVPVEAVLGPLALYVADTGWTLVRRIRRGAAFLQAHREHGYQRLCDVGWSHQVVTAVTAGFSAVVTVLGAVSIVAPPGLRAAADVAALAVLVGYLAAPGLLLPSVWAESALILSPVTYTGRHRAVA